MALKIPKVPFMADPEDENKIETEKEKEEEKVKKR